MATVVVFVEASGGLELHRDVSDGVALAQPCENPAQHGLLVRRNIDSGVKGYHGRFARHRPDMQVMNVPYSGDALQIA